MFDYSQCKGEKNLDPKLTLESWAKVGVNLDWPNGPLEIT